MLDISHFHDAIKRHYTTDENSINFYSEIFNETKNENLLDSNFITQMSSLDKTLQRLSELLILKYCKDSLSSIGVKINSKDEGPDISFNFSEKKINIEIITPIQVDQKKSSLALFSNESPSNPVAERRGSVEQYIPEMESLHARITGSLKEKSEKYEKYLSKETINPDDFNIVCINLGFIKNNEFIDYNYLKNLFKKQEVIMINIDENKNITHSIEDRDFHVHKKNLTNFRSSYFDNKEYLHIDGVWIISCNEKNFKFIKNIYFDKFEKCKNILYANGNEIIHKDLTSILSINEPEKDYFTNYIRKNGKLPD
ncbi:hypothetical protein ABRP56_03400 [Pectobacterium odoriferum]|uniref:hypothetical protein n=1 Tax=Pectobacterium odoriferum TaxID=78398 RepID=UPI0032ED1CB6